MASVGSGDVVGLGGGMAFARPRLVILTLSSYGDTVGDLRRTQEFKYFLNLAAGAWTGVPRASHYYLAWWPCVPHFRRVTALRQALERPWQLFEK